MDDFGSGRVALVTGAGKRRVGNVVARSLSQRGYAIGIHYHRSQQQARQTADALRQQGAEVHLFQADLAAETEVQRMFGQVGDRFGRLDVLVTAAAIWEPKPLEKVAAIDLLRHFEINALGTFLCCQKAGLIMVDQPRGGAIVTIGDWAIRRPYCDYAAYFPSKGAIPAITRSLAVELASRNPAVRVNCVLPGPVMLPDHLTAQQRNEVVADTLLQREGTPEHVAHAVMFLVENDFVTGVCLPVDGGRSIAGSHTTRS